jgi:hypothetical protein
MLGLALLVAVLAGSVFVAGSMVNDRVVPGPEATTPVTVVRATDAPPRTTERPTTTAPRTPRPARTPADWVALGDLTDQFGGGSVSLVTRAPNGDYLAFGLDPTGATPIVWSSQDGRAWREVGRPVDTFGAGAPTAAAPGGAGLIVVGREVRVEGARNAMWTTADGRWWRRLPEISAQIATRQGAVRIAAGPMGLLAWLPNGRGWWSADGDSWRRAASLGADLTDVAIDQDAVLAVGRDGDRVWVAGSDDGLAWPDASRTTLGASDQMASGEMPGVEPADGLAPLVWVGTGRLVTGTRGRWRIANDERLPAALGPGQVFGGPRGYLAVAAIDPGSGAHRAWTSDGQGTWTAVEGSGEDLPRLDEVFIVDVVADGDGWLIVMREGARYTGWRVDR